MSLQEWIQHLQPNQLLHNTKGTTDVTKALLSSEAKKCIVVSGGWAIGSLKTKEALS